MRRLPLVLLISLLLPSSASRAVEAGALARYLSREYEHATYFLTEGGYGSEEAPALRRAGEYLAWRWAGAWSEALRELAAVVVYPDVVYWVWAYTHDRYVVMKASPDGGLEKLGFGTEREGLRWSYVAGVCADGTPVVLQRQGRVAEPYGGNLADWVIVASAPLYGSWETARHGYLGWPKSVPWLGRLEFGAWAQTDVLLVWFEGPLLSVAAWLQRSKVWCETPREVGISVYDSRTGQWAVYCHSLQARVIEGSRDPRACWQASPSSGL